MFGRVYAWFTALYQLTSAPLGSEVSLKDGVALATRDHTAMSIYSVASDDAFLSEDEVSASPTSQPAPANTSAASNTIAEADRFMLAARLQSVATLSRPTERAWLAHKRHPAFAKLPTVKRTTNRVVWRERRVSCVIPRSIPTGETRTGVLTLETNRLGRQKSTIHLATEALVGGCMLYRLPSKKALFFDPEHSDLCNG